MGDERVAGSGGADFVHDVEGLEAGALTRFHLYTGWDREREWR